MTAVARRKEDLETYVRINSVRTTHDVLPNKDRSNYRFIRRRTNTDAKPAPWYVIDLLTDTAATGTDALGYYDEEEARSAQFRCNQTYGTWR